MSLEVSNLERKIINIGRSHGVTLPNEMLKKHGIDPGDVVNVISKDGEIVIQKSRKVNLPEGISSDFFDVLERNAKKHDETIKELKDR
ncbi:AbrB/MazE/SpoVT family DNA-binding domain-containing protein [Salibacterium aidingense]|uniref:AbrB/MazE/SpoVT family DNA-binding domain-containing protein n=1 Tax=Salibacterium aidingense TaxID=384933 RepID=UPI0004202CC5|nr:AbrB/MazE/SpoVT family DNA-binding domain-containing protein [Salibacterium aidingense]